MGLFELGRGNVPDRLEEAARVVPRDPLERRELDLLDSFPRPAPVNHFGLVQADDGFRECVIVRIARAADRRLDPRVREALSVSNRQVLQAAVTVMDQRLGAGERTVVERLRQPPSCIRRWFSELMRLSA